MKPTGRSGRKGRKEGGREGGREGLLTCSMVLFPQLLLRR